jgi:Protein of unknown function (DUF3147)
MIVQFKPSALGQTRWYEYLVRFVLGGAMTVVAGLIAARFGPVIGGLFLAFPAIFPASATLIEKHVRERKEKAGCESASEFDPSFLGQFNVLRRRSAFGPHAE